MYPPGAIWNFLKKCEDKRLKIYITRHGQVLDWGIGGDAQFPKGDPPLSPLGREQATQLGKYLKHLGFSGKIYSSPFYRALETAQAIAEQTGSLIVPWAPIREIVKTKESTADFTGLTLEQIREKFRFIDPDAALPYPWWGLIPEGREDVIGRIQAGLQALAPTGDILLVGHGASVYCACELLQLSRCQGDNYNCGFSMYDSADEANFSYMDGSHLPYPMRTFNRIWKKEEDEKLTAEFLEQGLQLPELLTSAGQKILFVGNTCSCHYPYLQKVIEAVKPQTIVHTGNAVGEVKASCIPDVQEEYRDGVLQIAEILKNSGAEKIYITPGMDDIPHILQQLLPFAEFSLPEGIALGQDRAQWSVQLLPEGKHCPIALPECYHWNRL